MKLSNFILFQFIAIGIVFLITVVFGNVLPLPVYILLFVVLASGIFLCGFFNIVKKERYYAQEDMSISRLDHLKHITSIGIFSLLSIFGALVFSSNKSAFSPSIITGFLFRVFKHNSPEFETVENPTILETFFSSISKIDQYSPWPIRTWLQYGFIFLAAVGFLLLIILPQIYQKKASQKIPVHTQGVFSSIIDWFKGVLLALSAVFTRKKRRIKNNNLYASEIARMAKKILASYSPEKKRAMRESVTLFAQLIIWGNNVRQVLWKPAHAPGEYCGLLTTALPEWEHNRKIILCGELFEKALYSSQVLSPEEQKEFTNLVKEITAEND